MTSATMEVIYGHLTASFSASSHMSSPLQVNFFNHSFSSLNTLSITSSWNFGNGQSTISISSNVSPNATYVNAGTYTVTLKCTKGTCKDSTSIKVYPGLPSQAWVGLEELEPNTTSESVKYFDLMGHEQMLEKNKLLMEQNGTRRRKIIILDSSN